MPRQDRTYMLKIAVLGAGRVGKAIAADLAGDSQLRVTVVDRCPEALGSLAGNPAIRTVQADLSDPGRVQEIMADYDLGVGAVPGFMGFQTLRAILEAGKPAVDIAFFPEDPFRLDELARKQGVVAIVDAGVAPGCSSMVLGHLEEEMDKTTRFECLVGGLPMVRRWPFQYKAPFSPLDVIEEYTRPARIRRNGGTVVVPALSEVELIDFPEVGALEAFNTDGLRSLLATSETPEMVEKTLRYPGHAEWMRGLRDTGFFDLEEMEIGGARVSPMEMTAKLLLREWTFEEKEEDLTVMRILVEGEAAGKGVRHTYHMFDRYDVETGTSSMARTTGYTCTAMVRLVARNLYTRPGISPPELVGRNQACFDFVLDELAARNVKLRHEVEVL